MEIYSFWIFPGSVGNYKLLRASYKSMESMEIIFHSVPIDQARRIKNNSQKLPINVFFYLFAYKCSIHTV